MCERGRTKASEGLVVVTGFGPVAKDLTDVAVGPLVALAAVVGGVRRGVGHLHLRGAVLCVVEVKAVADVAEQPRGKLLLHGLLFKTAEKHRSMTALSTPPFKWSFGILRIYSCLLHPASVIDPCPPGALSKQT